MGRRHIRHAQLASALLALLGSTLPGSAGAATLHQPLAQVAAETKYDDDPLIGGAGLLAKVSPEVGYRQKAPTRTLELRYAADLIEYVQTLDTSVDHRARIDYRERFLEHLTVKSSGFVYRVSDATSVPRLGVARIRAPALWAKEDASLGWQFGHRETLTFGYSGEFTKVYGEQFPVGVVHAPYGLLEHRLTRHVTVGAKYRYQIFTSNLQLVSDAQGAFATVRVQPLRHLFLGVEGGPMFFRAAGVQAVVPRVGGDITYEGRGLEIGMSGGRDLVGAAGYATAIWADYLQAGVSWRLNRPFSLFVEGGLFRNGLAPAEPVTASGYGLSTGAEWRFAHELSAVLVYDRISQTDVALTGLQLGRNIATVRLVWKPLH